MQLHKGEPQTRKKVSCLYITTFIIKVTRYWDDAPAYFGGKRSMMCEKLAVVLEHAHEKCMNDGSQLDLKWNQKQHEASFNAHA
jgi:hypothetical protein